MSDTIYCYPPDHIVLRNKLDLRNPEQLDRFERRSVVQRMTEGAPSGAFDLAHLRAIHRHLFQDVYDWAGELRTVEIAKGGNQFQLSRYILTGMADVHRRLTATGYLKGLSAAAFSTEAAPLIGDINYVHPFREGNGRTLLIYLEQLAGHAGHRIDLRRIGKDDWIAASKAAFQGHNEPFATCIAKALDITS